MMLVVPCLERSLFWVQLKCLEEKVGPIPLLKDWILMVRGWWRYMAVGEGEVTLPAEVWNLKPMCIF